MQSMRKMSTARGKVLAEGVAQTTSCSFENKYK